MSNVDIAVVISDLGTGGAQKIATTLMAWLVKKGVKVMVITLAAPHDFFKLPAEVTRFSLYEVSESHNLFQAVSSNIRRIFKLRRILKAQHPRVVLSFIGPTNIIVILAAFFLSMRVVISERNDPSRQSFGRFWDGLRFVFYRFADVVTANSEHAIAVMKSYVPVRKLKFVPNHLALPLLGTISAAEREKIILAVGRLHPQKGYDILLAAFARICNQHPDWSLVILGKGPLRYFLQEQAEKLSIADRVKFMGVVPEPYLFYRKASVFVLASRHEGTPNALLEAMSCSIPSIVSKSCKGALCHVQDQVSGLTFKTDDVEDLADKVLMLIEHPEIREQLGIAAKEAVAPLSDDRIFDEWFAVLEGKS